MEKTVKPLMSIFAIFLCTLVLVSCNKPKDSHLESILKSGKIRIGLSPDYMPFEMLDKAGSLMGFDIDLADLIADSMGVKTEFIQVTDGYDNLVPRLKNGDFDIILSGMTATQKRNLVVNFSEPYMITGQTLLVNKKLKDKIKSYKDLNSAMYQVVYEQGTSAKIAIERLFPKCRFISVESADVAVKMVKNGEADALVYDQPYCANIMAMEGSDAFLYLDQPITFEPLSIAIPENDLSLLNWMNTFIRQIQSDGRYDDLYSKWFENSVWMKRLE